VRREVREILVELADRLGASEVAEAMPDDVERAVDAICALAARAGADTEPHAPDERCGSVSGADRCDLTSGHEGRHRAAIRPRVVVEWGKP
jgi:hypothetical protein